jgi:hypothetical protein
MDLPESKLERFAVENSFSAGDIGAHDALHELRLLRAAVKAQSSLLVAYRVGRPPSEKVLDTLADLRPVIDRACASALPLRRAKKKE